MSTIEWTDETWNPIAGCSPVSEGCRNCYAAKEAIRLGGNPHPAISGKYAGTSVMRGLGKARRAVFTGLITYDEAALVKPLSWKKPRRVFVNSMSDLFHEAVPFDFIDRVFAVMALADRHTFQILTKRPERMAEYFGDELRWAYIEGYAQKLYAERTGEDPSLWLAVQLPLPNVWLGTSVEDQAAADARIPHLLRTPAAVRFLSCEPLLGQVQIAEYLPNELWNDIPSWRSPTIHWVIVGGESGPGARICDLDYVESLVEQSQTAGVPVFVKQLGAKPWRMGDGFLRLEDRKGGEWDEWPEHLRVREFPEVPR